MEMAVMETQFKVIIPYYNCKEWIVKCVESILSQTYQNFHILLIDDASTDGGNAIALEKYWTHPKISCGKNLSNCGALYNISMEVKHDSIKNEDVIVLVDGDDWLANENVFEKINEIYQDPNIWLTYGQYKHLSEKHRGICAHLSNTRRYRKYRPWKTSHLRTFKKHLWNRIHEEDLKDTNGNFYSMAWDLSFMFPMIEMAGLERIKYIRDILYVYNDLNPINDDKKNRQLQLDFEKEIRSKDLYDEV